MYLGGLSLIGFWPTPVDRPIQGTLASVLGFLHGFGAPSWFDYHFVEASANVAIFVPLGILASLALPTKSWWQLAGIGLLASTCMELGQLLFISSRYASYLDVVTNSFGAVTGILSTRLVVRLRNAREAKA
ncbi:VanZ family protein [Paenarthrobacter sp. AB444]|nr:VanZ family protein [Paenarthrobacter sp. AB444]MDD7835640.1 VanZ family protein [Paenarthrobacter sp. AB444]